MQSIGCSRLLILTGALLTVAACLAATAQPSKPAANSLTEPLPEWLQVEVIIVQQEFNEDTLENWPALNKHPLPTHYAYLSDQSLSNIGSNLTARTTYPALQKDQQTLSTTVQKLQRNHTFFVLTYAGWMQPYQQAEPIRIEGGQYYEDQPELIGTIQIQPFEHVYQLKVDLWFRTFEVSAPTKQQAARQHRWNVMEFEDEAEMTAEERWLASASPDDLRYELKANYSLQQTEVVTPKTLHYIDSPVIGVIIKLTPILPSQEKPAS
ncbi:CsiV family protein [Zooshikella ganghwensis]|uniref:CsiV family protein n=1 Tax=Zooshikella ganghwensis TaxID=202772 RepID=UPI00048080A5|nr:CsiV family protein [Zooshikella ganghwensis]